MVATAETVTGVRGRKPDPLMASEPGTVIDAVCAVITGALGAEVTTVCGTACTTTRLVVCTLLPAASATVSVMVYGPGVVYVWEAFTPVAVEPSPKRQEPATR